MQKIIISIIITLLLLTNVLAETSNLRPNLPPVNSTDSKLVVIKLAAVATNRISTKTSAQYLSQVIQNYSADLMLNDSVAMLPAATVRQLKAKLPAHRRASIELDRYHYLELNRAVGTDFLQYLQQLPEIDLAYFAPLPAKPPVRDILPKTPNFTGQGYLGAAPRGINAKYANSQSGGKGQNIKLVDIEYAWILGHEDLNLRRSNFILNNRRNFALPKSYAASDHGSAVLGVIAGLKNAYGISGIVPEVTALLATPVDEQGSYSIPAAIVAAVNATSPGDVILIEQQYNGPEVECRCSPCTYFVPVEYYQAEFEAIRAAGLAGRIVVEAAGNGGQDLDSSVYQGIFAPDTQSSMAIMVAAIKSRDRAGHCFSNAGSRIDLSAWGDRVVSTGYGDLFNPLPAGSRGRKKQQYTRAFSGTSSASAIIAGAVAAIQGYAKANGGILTRDELLSLLSTTGTAATDPLDFAVMPDLKAAIELLRTQRGQVR